MYKKGAWAQAVHRHHDVLCSRLEIHEWLPPLIFSVNLKSLLESQNVATSQARASEPLYLPTAINPLKARSGTLLVSLISTLQPAFYLDRTATCLVNQHLRYRMVNQTHLTIQSPDDFHVHFRDGQVLKVVAPFTAAQFSRALIMPNLKPPIRTLQDALAYRQRIEDALPPGHSFTPLMTLYLTDDTTPADIKSAFASHVVVACKLYPAGATTNSALGVTSLDNVSAALAAMQDVGMVLCIHGEATSSDIDVFDKEAEFVHNSLPKVLADFPTLKIVLEHVTTGDAVEAVRRTPGNRLAATITPHHLLYSRQAIFAGAKIHPHMFCLPILKRENHRQALLKAIVEDGDGKFFAGTDSAPHTRDSKICEEGCAGIFSGHCGVELYAEAFEKAGALHKLESFLSINGARFYGLKANEGTISLSRRTRSVPKHIPVPGNDPIVPLRAGLKLSWTIDKA